MGKINKDSNLWNRTYEHYKKQKVNVVSNKPVVKKNKPAFLIDKSDDYLVKRLKEIEKEKIAIEKEIQTRESIKNKKLLPCVSLYALKLENGCWYIGISYNVDKRFKKHLKGKGSIWTKKNKPIEIHETRETGLTSQVDATSLENDMTLEYALLYGPEKVRGGGYTQTKPRWPDIIIQSEVSL